MSAQFWAITGVEGQIYKDSELLLAAAFTFSLHTCCTFQRLGMFALLMEALIVAAASSDSTWVNHRTTKVWPKSSQQAYAVFCCVKDSAEIGRTCNTVSTMAVQDPPPLTVFSFLHAREILPPYHGKNHILSRNLCEVFAHVRSIRLFIAPGRYDVTFRSITNNSREKQWKVRSFDVQ